MVASMASDVSEKFHIGRLQLYHSYVVRYVLRVSHWASGTIRQEEPW